MVLQVEDVDGALPDRVSKERLFDGHSFDQRGLSAVLAFNGSLELVNAYVHGTEPSMVLPRALSALSTSFPLEVVRALKPLAFVFRRGRKGQLHRLVVARMDLIQLLDEVRISLSMSHFRPTCFLTH